MQFCRGDSRIFRYGIAAAGCAMALLARLALDPYLGPNVPYTVFFAAIAVAALFGGFGPAIVSTVVCFLAADFFFIGRRSTFSINTIEQQVDALCYLVICLLIATLGHKIRKAR